MFVEEGFRIRFANGEVIDFYADSTELKEEWMVALAQVVGKGIVTPSHKDSKGWTDMVLKREKSTVRKQAVDPMSRAAGKPVEAPVRKTSDKQQQQIQHQPQQPARALSPTRPKSPVRQHISSQQQQQPLPSSIPSPAGKRPVTNARQSTGHMRTESYQPTSSGAKSQSNSPVKNKFGLGGMGISSEDRRRKARSMLM